MLGANSAPLMPVPATEGQAVEAVSHRKSKKDKKKEKRDKYRVHITSVAKMIGQKSSPNGRSAKSLGKKSRSLQLACTKILSTSQMGEEGTQSTKKQRFSDVTVDSDGAEGKGTILQDHGIPPRVIEAVYPMATTDAKITCFQDHNTLPQDEVFAPEVGMSANQMLRAGYDILQKGQQLFQQIRKAMDQQAKSMETFEAQQTHSLRAIEASNIEL